MDDKIETLKELINTSKNIVFFGGAGVSTESGVPDFRSKDGLYNENYKFPPEEILNHDFFIKNPEEFFRFYRCKMNSLSAKPNVTHLKLAELEKVGKLKAIITQNIDGLHFKAGSKSVIELHGSIYRNYCTKCGRFHTPEYVFNSKGIPICERKRCDGIVKPDVVLYGEHLDDDNVFKAVDALEKADLLIIGGSSLSVYPANTLINYFRGENVVLINKDETVLDSRVDLLINKSLGEVFSAI